MYKLLAVLAFTILSFDAHAKDVFDYPITNINEVSQVVYTPSKLSGNFTQNKEVKEVGVKLKSQGTFIIDKQKGVKWSLEKPFINTIIIEDDKICFENTNNSKVIKSDSNQTLKHVVTVMQSLLTQDYDELTNYFDIFFINENEGFRIGLKTKDATIANVFSKLEVSGKKYVQEVTLYSKEGDKTTISFSNITETAKEFSCAGK